MDLVRSIYSCEFPLGQVLLDGVELHIEEPSHNDHKEHTKVEAGVADGILELPPLPKPVHRHIDLLLEEFDLVAGMLALGREHLQVVELGDAAPVLRLLPDEEVHLEADLEFLSVDEAYFVEAADRRRVLFGLVQHVLVVLL